MGRGQRRGHRSPLTAQMGTLRLGEERALAGVSVAKTDQDAGGLAWPGLCEFPPLPPREGPSDLMALGCTF